MAAAPRRDLHFLFNEGCLGPGIVGLDAKVGLSLEHAPTPVAHQRKTHTTSRTSRQFTGELVWKERTHSCLTRKQHFYRNQEVKSTESNDSSRETEMAEQCARRSDENFESRCSTNWG